ncbi:MAG TPA: response regulator [Gemmatimonadales bacterium]|nr:response regulator [Gemmatimonadales bacterium]
MSEIRAVIVDDEPLARRGVRQLLAAHPDVVVVGECRNGKEALRALDALRPDLLFLDVQMPGLDGFGVLRARKNGPLPCIVFVTAYDEFAVRAFEAHALDYLVKPLAESRFNQTIDRVRERLRLLGAEELASRVAAVLAADTARKSGASERVAVSTGTGRLLLDSGEIDWVEARDYYAGIHAGGRRHLVRESLASLAKRLDPSQFVRVHRRALVRLDRVRELIVTPGKSLVVLRDGTRVPVSRRRRERLAALLRTAR